MGDGLQIGIGAGLAQRIDTSRYVSQILRQQELNYQRHREDSQAIASMLNRYRPEGVRMEDLPKYQQTYNQLQDLYIQNKDLYTNPAKYQDQYNKAQGLMGSLAQQAAESKQYDKNHSEIGKSILDHRDKYEDDAPATWQQNNELSIDDLKKKYNGQLPSLATYDAKPADLNHTKIAEEIKAFGKSSSVTLPTLSHKDDPNIPVGQIKMQTNTVNDPQTIGMVAENHWTDSNTRKLYTKLYADYPPLQLQALQNSLNKELGNQSFQIKDPHSFAVADFMLRHHTIAGTPEYKPDEQYKEGREDMRFNRQTNREAWMQQRGFDHTDANLDKNHQFMLDRDAAKAKARNGDEDKLNGATEDIHHALLSGDRMSIIKATDPMYKAGDKYATKPEIIDPRGQTEDEFLRLLKMKAGSQNYVTDPTKSRGMYSISEDEARALYKKQVPAMLTVVKEGKGKNEKKVTHIHNPLSSSFGSRLYAELKTSAGGSRKYGLDSGDGGDVIPDVSGDSSY